MFALVFLRKACLNVSGTRLEEVSTTCGSGWVNPSGNKIASMIDPPATAGGTDLLQVPFLTFEAKPLDYVITEPLLHPFLPALKPAPMLVWRLPLLKTGWVKLWN